MPVKTPLAGPRSRSRPLSLRRCWPSLPTEQGLWPQAALVPRGCVCVFVNIYVCESVYVSVCARRLARRRVADGLDNWPSIDP